MPEESDSLLQFLKGFVEEIKAIGKTQVTPNPITDSDGTELSVTEILSSYDVYACQDCGKCSSACPLTLSGKSFSPRAIASAIIAGDVDSPSVQEDVFSCLTCGLCYDRCPSAVT